MLKALHLSRVYVACGTTDLRKSIDGLVVLVQEQFHLDPFSPALFIFCNPLQGAYESRKSVVSS